CGAVPVFVDVDPETGNMAPEQIEAAMSSRTRAILCVHQFGMPCDLAAVAASSRRLGLPLIEDAACAVGSEIELGREWERVGRPHGDIACFSFHPRKLLTTGDGGMLTTCDESIDRKLRLWRQHSMSVPDTVRHSARDVVFEEYEELGYNYRMTDIQAAVGRAQLSRLPDLLARRRMQAARYRTLLGDIPGLVLPCEPAWARTNWQSFAVGLPGEADQLETMRSLLEAGVSTRRGVMASHLEPAYSAEPWRCWRGCSTADCRHLPETLAAQSRKIILPLYHEMGEDDQVRVAEAFREALANR
ncbi:MAG TPA: DegT/DnrJ/EryC1/StrS family aminotransferase, partial [Tepidiformaceae bacterium]|nr:DegT/DnrJ/EryC1/StrS family aminotransferase [Tepidiformaceae bacterium]